MVTKVFLLYTQGTHSRYRIRFNICGVKLSWIADSSNFSVSIFADIGS